MDITIGARNEFTKRFNFVRGADGDVSFDDTEAHAVITSVIERKNSYWADPTHGSDLWTLRHLTSRTRSQAESMVLDALLPLEQSNTITGVEVVATTPRENGQLSGRLNTDVKWTTPGGIPGNVTVEI